MHGGTATAVASSWLLAFRGAEVPQEYVPRSLRSHQDDTVVVFRSHEDDSGDRDP